MAWHLTVAGLIVGWLVGATGMGGGSLMTPILVLLFGFPPTVAVGTDIVHGALFKTFGAIRHRHLGTVHGRLSGWMLIGSGPASIGGVIFATWLRHHYGDPGAATKNVLGAALVIGGVGTVAKVFVRSHREIPTDFRLARNDRIAAVAIGVFGGFMVGLTSIGTGVFFGLTMLIAFPLRSSKVVGTDVFHAAALLWIAGAGHIVAGNVDMRTVGWLLTGSIAGVLLGAQTSVKLPDRALRTLLGTTLVAVGVVMGGLLIGAVAAAVPILAVGAFMLFRRLRPVIVLPAPSKDALS
jgi:uncharacterized membrane protein YfcA